MSRAARPWPKRGLSAFAVLAVFGLLAGFAVAPPPGRADAIVASVGAGGTQSFTVASGVVANELKRDLLSATPGAETLAAGGTNADWAKLVLIFGQWPPTDENVTVILRWMRQENYPPSWWNRNNPLNNGYLSGGGGGYGRYDNLVIAAEAAADNLHNLSSYDGIVAALADGSSADVTAQAIWASPWASSHYANGSHWSTTPVDIVKAPESAW